MFPFYLTGRRPLSISIRPTRGRNNDCFENNMSCGLRRITATPIPARRVARRVAMQHTAPRNRSTIEPIKPTNRPIFPQAPISKPNNMSNREFLFYKPLKEYQKKYKGRTVEGPILTNEKILTYAKLLALRSGQNAADAQPGVTSRGIKYTYWNYNNEPLRMLLLNPKLGSPAGIMKAGKETANRFRMARGVGLSASEKIVHNALRSVANNQRNRNNPAAQKNLHALEMKSLENRLTRLRSKDNVTA